MPSGRSTFHGTSDVTRRWWIASLVLGLVAALSLVLHVRRVAAPAASSPTPSAPAIARPDIEAAIAIPADWSTFPVVATLDRTQVDAADKKVVEDGLFGDVWVAKAALGGTFVEYRWDQCMGGGSACAGSPPSLHHLRVGQLDEAGHPSLALSFTCQGTSPLIREEHPRSCAPSSLTLRRRASNTTDAPRDATYVLTFRDPDATEIAIGAFVRAPREPVAGEPARWRTHHLPRDDQALLLGVAIVFLAAGVIAMRHGIHLVRATLAEPAAIPSTSPYRALAEMPRAPDGAQTRATRALFLACAAYAVSGVISTLALAVS